MTLFETGRVCIKTAGREAGKLCVVLNKAEGDLVLVTGPKSLSGVRRRNCSVTHLEPLQAKISLKAGATDSDVLDLLKKEDELLKKLNLKVPTAEEIKKAEELRKQKDAARKEAEKKKVAEKPKEEKVADKKEEKPAEAKKEEPKPTEKTEAKKEVSEKPKEEKKPKKEAKSK
ncbi:MAG TPA: hypothetical protein VJA47_03500 [archaeon]|nr:hypothetical protein [archaeon]